MKINGQKLWEPLFSLSFFQQTYIDIFYTNIFFKCPNTWTTVFLTSFLILTSLALKCPYLYLLMAIIFYS